MDKSTENKSSSNGFRSYEISKVKGIKAMHVGDAPSEAEIEANPKAKPVKAPCEVCQRNVRYQFETAKGGKVCSSCLKLANPSYYTQKVIDKMYNVAYYSGGSGARISVEERQAALKELF
jgi:hypothetical protein